MRKSSSSKQNENIPFIPFRFVFGDSFALAAQHTYKFWSFVSNRNEAKMCERIICATLYSHIISFSPFGRSVGPNICIVILFDRNVNVAKMGKVLTCGSLWSINDYAEPVAGTTIHFCGIEKCATCSLAIQCHSVPFIHSFNRLFAHNEPICLVKFK